MTTNLKLFGMNYKFERDDLLGKNPSRKRALGAPEKPEEKVLPVAEENFVMRDDFL